MTRTSSAPPPRPHAASVPARLGRYVLRMFRPHVYVTYGVLWALALEGSAPWLSRGPSGWSPGRDSAARAAAVVLTLLFLRMLDEIKDLGYDRVHHPDRPLVTGAVGAGELHGAMALIVVLLVALNAGVSAGSAALVLIPPAYGLMLLALERRSAAVRDGLLLSLALSYPVQLLLGTYVYLSAADSGAIAADWRAVPLLLLFACAYLQFEFARKTEWGAADESRSYSNVLGPAGSALTGLALAGAAGGLALFLFRPWEATGGALPWAWLPYPALALPVLGTWRFLRRRRPGGQVVPAMGFLVVFYAALVLQAALR